MNKKYEKIVDIINNDTTLEEVLQLKSTKDFCKYLNDQGIDLSFGEVQEVVAAIITISEQKESELTPENLENISGGVAAEALLGWMWSGAKWAWDKTRKAGRGFANWEDNGCKINGKKYC